MKMLRRLFGGTESREPDAGSVLYGLAVAQARRPFFYRDLGIPDTVDGRFEMIVLHVFLILHALENQGRGAASETGQRLFDVLFADMDRSLREMGAGDTSVGRKIKAMASAFYGRCAAYRDGLHQQDDAGEALAAALRRNIWPGEGEAGEDAGRGATILAAYMRRESARLAATGPDSGAFCFSAPEGAAELTDA